ncbi:hypothetical protein CEN44_08090 [Fischerella muscicola CCMEE 5323]|uniref:Uncharacterized protein n=1 Tax=Fischerella muscicola CCMEE 5323 TaxID=2019572 RepID=A0A2N6K5B3_FISMU|nr:hypothetical protein CEN44_08090 [Fischerella muscicola CCMEE 5323]
MYSASLQIDGHFQDLKQGDNEVKMRNSVFRITPPLKLGTPDKKNNFFDLYRIKLRAFTFDFINSEF